jgi:hypothetical protein
MNPESLYVQAEVERGARIFSPRLAHPEQAVDFEMDIIKESPDASVWR